MVPVDVPAGGSIKKDSNIIQHQKSNLYYENPNQFLNLLTSQRLLRRLDELHLLDSSGRIIMSNIIDARVDFVPPPDEAFTMSLSEKVVRIVD